jgi:hypothetical protein
MSAGYFSFLVVATTLLVGCTPSEPPRTGVAGTTNAPQDPIDRLVAICQADQHSGSGEVFPSGLFSPIALPPSALAAELVSQAFERQAGDAKAHTNFTILANRKVRIGDERMAGLHLDSDYTAVLVDTRSGKKIVLLQFQAASKGWWNRVYDDAK